MKQQFIRLLNKTDWKDLRACMCCREVCEFYTRDDTSACLICPVYSSENFKQLLQELQNETAL